MRLRVLPPLFYRSLRMRMMAWLGTLLLVVFISMAFLVFIFLRVRQESLWNAYLQDLNHETVSNVESFLSVYERVLRSLSVLNPEDERTASFTRQILRDYVAFKEIVWVDDSGKVVLHQSSGEAVMGNLFTVRQSVWFQAALRGERYLSSAQPSHDGDFLLLMAIPAENGGVIAGLIRVDVFLNRVLTRSKDYPILTWIIKENGEVLAHPNRAWIRSSVQELPLWEAVKRNGNPAWSGRITSLEGGEVLAVTAPMQEPAWVVVSEVPFQQVRKASLQAIGVLGAGVLVLFFGLTYWSRWYLRLLVFTPLEQLRQAIERWKQGERRIHLSIDREDELGALANAFNGMFEQIKTRETQLEERNQALELETARRKHAMLELQRMAEQLEERVRVRTTELEQEIAERRQTEQELRLNLERLSLLNRLLQIHDPETSLEQLCRELGQSLKASLVMLLMREHASARMEVRAVYSMREMSFPERLDPQSDVFMKMFYGNSDRIVPVTLSQLDTQPPFVAGLMSENIEHLLLLHQIPSRSSGSLLIVGRGDQPFTPVEVQTLEIVSGGIQQMVELALLYASLNDELSERRRIENILVYQNTRDSLTGLYNRRMFEERISYRAPHHTPVCIIALDLDHLKRVNDTFGHLKGDEYIRLVAQAIQASIRSEDMAARVGGDEFVVILNDADERAGEAVVERIQETLQSMLDPDNPIADWVRVSMGLAISQPGEPLLETFRRADSAMYTQKQHHRIEDSADVF